MQENTKKLAFSTRLREKQSGKSKRRITPYIFVLPSMLYLALFMLVPFLKGIQLSFTNTRITNPDLAEYIGFDNFVYLFSDPRFLGSIWTTLIYTALSVTLALLLGGSAALVLNQSFPGRAIARTLIVAPWAVPTVAVALVFRWLLNESAGVVNKGTALLGLGEPGWLSDPSFGMLTVVAATVWKISPFVMLVLLAALQSVPSELHEAARVDGAGRFQSFRAVTVPHVMPTVRIVGLLMTIWAFRRFEIIWLLTGGGPVDATNTLVINVYREAFGNSRLGLAAAAGMVGLVLSFAITILYLILERRRTKKDAG